MKPAGKKTPRTAKLPLGVYIAICALPAILTILFYLCRSDSGAMDWAAMHISAPIRRVLSLLSSVYPFSMMEILCAAAVIWLIYYITRTIVMVVRRRGKLKILLKRVTAIMVIALYAWCMFSWLWNSGYSARGFAEKNGFTGGGVSVEHLAAVTRLFAEKSNEFSLLVIRDEDSRYIEDRKGFFDISPLIYQNIMAEYPSLEGKVQRPKSMMFSWLMSRTGYTGIYFALTGESNINTRAPTFLMPATIAHELAHQLGVFAEDEATFVGIMASVTSGYDVYEYAGYMMGLMYLRSALYSVDSDAWAEISGILRDEVILDLQENYNYWESQKTVDTGAALFDNLLTSMTETLSDTVNTIYDGYLKAQNQELGVRSYGACVDLLVEYYSAESPALATNR